MSQEHPYVSEKLTHFVAASMQQDEDAQYDVLVNRILQDCLLTKPGNRPPAVLPQLDINRDALLTDNQMYVPQMVCFCDIPLKSLGVHIRKYGRFGLSFSKAFLVPKGARPVFYIPRAAGTYGEADHKVTTHLPQQVADRSAWDTIMGDFLDRLLKPLASDFLGEMVEWFARHPCKESQTFMSQALSLMNYLNRQFLAFTKCFDHSLPFDHEKNYYMEREWRVLGNVRFDLTDVRSVILPTAFVDRFSRAFPSLSDRTTPAEELTGAES